MRRQRGEEAKRGGARGRTFQKRKRGEEARRGGEARGRGARSEERGPRAEGWGARSEGRGARSKGRGRGARSKERGARGEEQGGGGRIKVLTSTPMNTTSGCWMARVNSSRASPYPIHRTLVASLKSSSDPINPTPPARNGTDGYGEPSPTFPAKGATLFGRSPRARSVQSCWVCIAQAHRQSR